VKEHHLNRWNPNQSEAYNLTHASYPLLHYDSYGDHNQRKNSFFLKNGNFLRLKNIELSYSLPAKWIRKVAMNECRVYVNANNLITWDKLDGLCDPESEGSNRYPIMKTVNFGVNIKF
ncbi:TonB-dependent receptor, partial [Bacteroides thetaiotaomicron]